MGFRNDVARFTVKVETTNRNVFVGVTSEVQRSIVEGSEITGAPGQPVDTGALKASWIPEFVSPTEWETSTNLVYAPIIEDNLRGATLRSSVGGFHSVKLTVAGFRRIVSSVVADVRGAR